MPDLCLRVTRGDATMLYATFVGSYTLLYGNRRKNLCYFILDSRTVPCCHASTDSHGIRIFLWPSLRYEVSESHLLRSETQ